MARRKRRSPVIAKAHLRAVSLRAISAELELTNELTLADFEAHISLTQAKLSEYNQKLSELDGLLNELEAEEKRLNEHTQRMLAAVAAVYGRDSSEYEQAGGKRRSEIKYRPSKPKSE